MFGVAAVVCATCLLACGRANFDRLLDAGENADASFDASDPCAAGDGKCLTSCVTTDPDCTTTCGDGRCVGNAGELCSTCMMDCDTQNAVCGNLACEAGESPDCVADCGPSPWPWTADESTLFTLVNQARTNGTACPGDAMTTAPALTFSASLEPGAREWAWEIAHGGFLAASAGDSCNGLLFRMRIGAGAGTTGVESESNGAAMNALNNWLGLGPTCRTLMDSNKLIAAPAVVHDASGRDAWVVIFQ